MSQRRRKRRRKKKSKRSSNSDVPNGQLHTQPSERQPTKQLVDDIALERLRQADRPSLIALIIANLFPFVAVLFFGWGLGDALVLYWIETLVVGCYAVLRILLASGKMNAETAPKLFMAPFFCVHFGGFCAIHGLFLLGLFDLNELGDITPSHNHEWPGPLVFLQLLFNVVSAMHSNLGRWGEVAVVCLVVSHGVSFMRNYMGRGEYQSTNPGKEMIKPYGRIVLMHICIIAGAFAVALFGSPVFLLVLFVGMKLAVDLLFHLRSHQS